MIEISLPDEAWTDVEEGTEALLDQWLVAEGSAVARSQAVALVVLVKTSYEVSAPADGRIARILVAPGETFARGRALAELEGAAASAPTGAAAPVAAPPAAAEEAPASTVLERIPFTGLRGAVVRTMASTWQTVPPVALFAEVETSAGDRRLETLQREVGGEPRLSLTHLILRAVALTLREHPRLNARVHADGIEVLREIHLGLAVNLEDALVVPVIRGADRRSIPELAREAQHLAAAARAGQLAPAAFQGGTFTVSNLGATGIDAFTPIINPPQVAILGVGRRALRAIVRDGRVVAAPTLVLTLVFDHRAIDGFPAATFLAALRARLERAADL